MSTKELEEFFIEYIDRVNEEIKNDIPLTIDEKLILFLHKQREETKRKNEMSISLYSRENEELEDRVKKLEDLCAEAMGEQPKEWRDRFKELLNVER